MAQRLQKATNQLTMGGEEERAMKQRRLGRNKLRWPGWWREFQSLDALARSVEAPRYADMTSVNRQ
jgi:hypothetical protein